jgi:ribosome biogenesis GTPase / thiamine phosphate phosphatase
MTGPTPAPPPASTGPEGLVALGWDDRLAGLHAAVAPELQPGRVVAEDRGRYLVASGTVEVPAAPSGRLRHAVELDGSTAWPAVGDWVGIQRSASDGHALIHAVLPRRTALVRHAPTDRGTQAQVLAANVDLVFVVSSLNGELNLRRLERYLAVAWDSGGLPVVVLSKADLADDADERMLDVAAVAPGVDVIPVSVVSGVGIAAVRSRLGHGRTVVFVGSSGVGKSSLVNALAGQSLLATGGIREDDARGRHTTTRRQLVRLSDGLVIDTPGLRELGVLDGDGVSTAFQDVETAAAACRFGDCRHETEPGCAVQSAVTAGRLSRDRLAAYRKLGREARRAELERDALARREERRRWTIITREGRRRAQARYGTQR